jgi:hypothetical protein
MFQTDMLRMNQATAAITAKVCNIFSINVPYTQASQRYHSASNQTTLEPQLLLLIRSLKSLIHLTHTSIYAPLTNPANQTAQAATAAPHAKTAPAAIAATPARTAQSAIAVSHIPVYSSYV